MDSPRLERLDDGRLYLIDAQAVRWRVHDVGFGPPHAPPHRFRRYPLADRRATSRAFVSGGSERRIYRFGRGEPRELTAEGCARQLAAAEYLAASAFDPRSREPW